MDPTPEEEEEIKLELSVGVVNSLLYYIIVIIILLQLSLSLEKGINISLINSVPEELIVASATGIRIEYVSTAVHQCLNATIQYIQVRNGCGNGWSLIFISYTG